MGNQTTDEDVRRAFADFLGALTPEDRQRLQQNSGFAKTLMGQRQATITRYIDSPEVIERRRQMSDFIARSA